MSFTPRGIVVPIVTPVTADGKLAAHFEHTVAITEGECVILTQC